jgi:hypothetical protein
MTGACGPHNLGGSATRLAPAMAAMTMLWRWRDVAVPVRALRAPGTRDVVLHLHA